MFGMKHGSLVAAVAVLILLQLITDVRAAEVGRRKSALSRLQDLCKKLLASEDGDQRDDDLDIDETVGTCHQLMREDWYDIDRYKPPSFNMTHYGYYDSCGDGPEDKRAVAPNAVRVEYRRLTRDQRNAFHRVLQTMKATNIEGVSVYDIFSQLHVAAVAPGAHFGTAFPCWHREYLQRFENAMRRIDPRVYMPYLDTSLENLPRPADSCLWHPDYLGTARGTVRDGPFRNWPVTVGECSNIAPLLTRGVLNQNSMLYHDGKFNYFSRMRSIGELTAQGQFSFEGAHGEVHVWAGGHMASLNCAPNDPTFWMHHCMMDLTFEATRARAGWRATVEYPQNNPRFHNARDPMAPHAPRVNIDGIRPEYTRDNYVYDARPNDFPCRTDFDCAPDGLWCNAGRCLAKIVIGGRCDRFPHNCCYGVCARGRQPQCLLGACRC